MADAADGALSNERAKACTQWSERERARESLLRTARPAICPCRGRPLPSAWARAPLALSRPRARRPARSERGLQPAAGMARQRSGGPPRLDPALEELFAAARRRAADGGGSLTLRAWLERAELWRILDALHEAGGNRSAAARALGIGRRTLYTKMEKLGIRPAWPSSRQGALGELAGDPPV
jgi:hypothetical protein